MAWSIGGTPQADVTDTAPYDFATGFVALDGWLTARVTDTLGGDATRVLAEALEGSRTFRYRRHLAGWPDKCRTFTNVARVVPPLAVQQDLAGNRISAFGAVIQPSVLAEDEAWVRVCPPAPPKDPKDTTPQPPKVTTSPGDPKDDAGDPKDPPVGLVPVDNPKGSVVADPKKGPGDLSVTKRAEAKSASPGRIVPWTITVTNTGKADLDDVVLVDRLPRHLRVVTGDKQPLSRKRPGSEVTIPVGDLLMGESRTFTVKTLVVGRPVMDAVARRQAARLRAAERAVHVRRHRKGIVCNLVIASAANAAAERAVACLTVAPPKKAPAKG